MSIKNTEEKVSVTGLDQATDKREAEYDLVTSLLKAANYKHDDDNITEVNITRNGEFLFAVHIRPLSESEINNARKKATKYGKNPKGKHLPQIAKEQDDALFKSWLIYLATTEEDQKKIWGNPRIMQEFGLQFPAESVDILLPGGDKNKLSDKVLDISGYGDDDDEEEQVDEVSF